MSSNVRQDNLNLNININGDPAQKQLVDLRKKAADVKNEMNGLTKGTAEYIAKNKELKEIGAEMDIVRNKIGLAALSMKDLRSEQTKLKALRDSVSPFTKDYDDYQKALTKVKDRIFEVENGVEGLSATLLKAVPQWKSLSVLTAIGLGAKAAWDWASNGISQMPKISDQIADLQRVSGMTSAEVDKLNDSLIKMDTRTSLDGLREIAIIAGKLGIAKEDIAAFTEATDKMVVALGDELGDADSITTNLGKILNVFEGKITADNLEHLGNAMVHMANAGVASAGYITDFTQRLSAMAETAHLSLSDVVGLGAGMEESGQRVESGSTAIVNLLGKMATNVTAFAKAAGKDVTEFANTVNNKPIEALLQLAEGVRKNKDGLTQLAPVFKDLGIDGSRVTATLSLMGSKADFFRGKMLEAGEAMNATGEITDAFNLKNNTLAGNIEKIGKNINAIWQNSRIASWLGTLLGGVNDLIAPTKNLTTEFFNQKEQVDELSAKILPMATRYDELKKKTNLNKTEQSELNKIITYLSSNIPGVVTEFDKYGNALGINTAKVREYIAAEQDRLKVVNADAINQRTKDLKSAQDRLDGINNQLRQAQQDGTITSNTTVSHSFGYTNVSSTVKATANDMRTLTTNAQAAQHEVNGLNAELKRLRGDDLKTTTPNTPKTTTPTTVTDTDAEKAAARAAKAAERAAQKQENAYQKLMNDIAKMREELENRQASIDDEEVARIQNKYVDLLQRAKKYANATLEIEGLRQQELDMLMDKRLKERLNKQAEEQKKQETKHNEDLYKDLQDRTELNYETQRVAQAQEFEKGTISYKQYNESLAKIDKAEADQKLANAQFSAGNSKQAEQDVVDFTKKAEKEKRDEIIKTLEARKEADRRAVDTAGMKAQTTELTTPEWSSKRLDAQKAFLEKQKEYELKYFTGTEDEKQALLENYQAQAQELEKQHQLAMLDYATQYVDAFSSALSSLNQFITNRETAELNKQKKVDDQKKASYKKQLDGKLISQKQYDAKTQAIDDAADQRDKIAQRKQAEREKAINMFNAITSNAAAILKTMASVPYPFNIPLAIAQGVAGALQIAAIANTPLPELGDGGLLTNGPKHKDKEKGLVVLNPRTGKTEMLLERNEAVLSSRTMDDSNQYTVTGTPSQIASALNGKNGGSEWDSGAVLQDTWATRAAPTISNNAVRVMALGGAVGSLAASNNVDNSRTEILLAQLVAENQQLRADVANWNTKLAAVVSLQDFKDKNKLYNAAQKASGM